MKKLDVYQQLLNSKLTVVVRGNSPEQAIETAEACIRGGVKSLEFTFTIPQAEKVIQHFSNHDGIIIGAGSVLDSETAKLAIHSGAEYIVGPNFSKETARLCNRYQVPYIPGCMTVNETIEALEFGSSIVKLFPGQAFSPSHIKAVKGPVPQVEIMPTGGVDLDNIQDWFRNGAVHVGVGGEITRPAQQGNFETVTANAKLFIEAIEEVFV
ncbi:bifunctional 4-hydroxy-2-oxoglutarate aldolase/2-dehydro-3-deoxy-phosphogluconate aldolase [Halobacillus trueperi]|uniref:Bifunctional 4-hydroxy-2-oxoglutarate aldolase/2-dehydro-3-deoxy-phosphogluconate aldolase n=1 Tax=Halobacillus trueperi TaxID=156205 RepID=A0A3D8VQV5_9BACI|nr:bifunctional 2-keto-4-hydroxyglutarate aldolase/2-keto-3-deoxy-6-phosphogluconate aldolase [Halobacillus trueperi]RDY71615.1 bifunctional 4-hydroxy-2-oxoglutarate aldolase/2-dehydro-3-deoxy-phosphogluconate aldolase [Halobacillus trueperi]